MCSQQRVCCLKIQLIKLALCEVEEVKFVCASNSGLSEEANAGCVIFLVTKSNNGYFVVFFGGTPWATNMEPENRPLESSKIPNLGLPFIFRGKSRSFWRV